MKRIFLFAALALVLTWELNAQNEEALIEINRFRSELNEQFRSPDDSPMTDEDRLKFKGLDFYEINLKYRVKAKVTLTPGAPVFAMATTTDRLPLYRKYAIVSFEIEGKEYKLSLYQNQRYMSSPSYNNELFLPFNDLSNGKESYGGGRYMNVKIPEEGADTLILDFNQTYNPYCAYNKKYSCPIPPRENNLDIEIPAGIKNFK